MSPRLSKILLTFHITFSVAWIGAIAVFLVLAITGLTSQDNQLARSSLIAMKISAWYVIVPFCLISFFTGFFQAIATKWGLFKYYWISVKLFLTVGSTVLLLLHLNAIDYLANLAFDSSFSNTQNAGRIIDLISKAGAAAIVLIAITTISIYKPWGKIELTTSNYVVLNKLSQSKLNKKSWAFYALNVVICLIIILIIKHLFANAHRH